MAFVEWFRNYLSERQQFVEIDGKKSQMALIQIGVPQGSILGPLLYLIYVNDICNSCQGNILSFADDTTLPPGNDTIWQKFPLKEYHMANLPPEEIPWQNFHRGETIPYGKASPSVVNLPPTQIS